VGALLPLFHAAILLTPGTFGFKLVLALALDLVGLALLAFYLARRALAAEAMASAKAEAPAEERVEAAAPAREPDIDAIREAEAAAARLGEIRALMTGCLESCDAILAEDLRLRGAGAEVSELSTALSGAREVSGLVHENTDKIFEIANNLANSAEQAFSLSHEVEASAAAMADELASSLAETEGLLVQSKKISDVLTIMTDISSTTNVLSINASIVAANAGAQGRQFAVVSKEMRKLSESTESSLKDITSIVRTIQEKIRLVSDRIRSVNDKVKAEQDSLVAVAGNLQGVVLANEVIRTVSGLCVQKTNEELECFRSMEGKVESAVRALEPRLGQGQAEGLPLDLRKAAEIAGTKSEPTLG
jgi:methyl-accepting chemotaxis protein